MVEVEEKGRQCSSDDIKDSKLIVKGDQMHFVRGAETVRVSFRLDPASKPKAIDLEEAKRGTLRGIYLLEEMKLTICISFALGAERKERPRQFKATRENRLTLMVFQREATPGNPQREQLAGQSWRCSTQERLLLPIIPELDCQRSSRIDWISLISDL